MPNQRSKKRNKLLGAYVTDEVYAGILARAKMRGVTVADYLRDLYRESVVNPGAIKRSGDHEGR